MGEMCLEGAAIFVESTFGNSIGGEIILPDCISNLWELEINQNCGTRVLLRKIIAQESRTCLYRWKLTIARELEGHINAEKSYAGHVKLMRDERNVKI